MSETIISVESKMERGEVKEPGRSRLIYVEQQREEELHEKPIIKVTTTVQKWVDYVTGMDEFRKNNGDR